MNRVWPARDELREVIRGCIYAVAESNQDLLVGWLEIFVRQRNMRKKKGEKEKENKIEM